MPADLNVAFCSREAAAYACKRWHYSHCTPAGKLITLGVWEHGQFAGSVVFGRGANNHIGSRYRLEQTEVCELVRIALTKHETPVSRIVAIALKFLRANSPGLRLIVSYADPEQGHHGGIYQAANWLYVGPSQAQRELVVNGEDMHKRSAGSRWGTASPARLRAMTKMHVDYGPVRWKHTYLLPLDGVMRAQIAPLAKPYPKRPERTGATNGPARAATNADKAEGDHGQPRQTSAAEA